MSSTNPPQSSSSASSVSPTLEGYVHRRLNILTGKHVLVSPHRGLRPWKGQVEEQKIEVLPEYEQQCYLCPGNSRVGGETNPKYTGQYGFTNDFPALMPQQPCSTEGLTGLMTGSPVFGTCKVLCYHPRHDLTMAKMEVEDIVQVIGAWQKIYAETSTELAKMAEEYGTDKAESYVQIFENRGDMMGASAPHPHGQVWATSFLPDEPETELANFVSRGKNLSKHVLLAYAEEEVASQSRVVLSDDAGWIAVVPYWASWPFEILILPSKRRIASLTKLTSEETDGLARILKRVLVVYDNLFACPFPYSMGIHQAPSDIPSALSEVSQLHIHFYPPLLRSSTVRKFMVGFEMMGELQRDLTPEQAAERLRAVEASL